MKSGLLILTALAVMLAAGCAAPQGQAGDGAGQQNALAPSNQGSECDRASEYARNNCYILEAAREKDTTLCDRIPDSDLYYFGCYAGVALEKGDLGVCGTIKAGSNSKEDNVRLCEEELTNECSCIPTVKELNQEACAQVKAKGISGACD